MNKQTSDGQVNRSAIGCFKAKAPLVSVQESEVRRAPGGEMYNTKRFFASFNSCPTQSVAYASKFFIDAFLSEES